MAAGKMIDSAKTDSASAIDIRYPFNIHYILIEDARSCGLL